MPHKSALSVLAAAGFNLVTTDGSTHLKCASDDAARAKLSEVLAVLNSYAPTPPSPDVIATAPPAGLSASTKPSTVVAASTRSTSVTAREVTVIDDDDFDGPPLSTASQPQSQPAIQSSPSAAAAAAAASSHKRKHESVAAAGSGGGGGGGGGSGAARMQSDAELAALLQAREMYDSEADALAVAAQLTAKRLRPDGSFASATNGGGGGGGGASASAAGQWAPPGSRSLSSVAAEPVRTDIGFLLARTPECSDYANRYSVTVGQLIQGDIKRAILGNYMFEIDWLVRNAPNLKSIPVVDIISGDKGGDLETLHQEIKAYKNFRYIKPNLPFQFSCHHSKFMVC